MDDIQSLESDFIRQFRSDPEVFISVSEIIDFLEASQYELIQLMVQNGIWQGMVPPDPGGEGSIEFGLVPYWISDPPPFILDYIDSSLPLEIVWGLLTKFIQNQISSENYMALKKAATTRGVVADDGTIFGESTYEQMDLHWLWAFINYLLVKYIPISKASFNRTPASPIQLTGAAPGEVKIAIVGDWGTGKYPTGPAEDIMSQIVSKNPDYIIHLGDVYYAGTTGDLFLPHDEEQDNFLDCWPGAAPFDSGRSFTLNSNHEMYGGANGYYSALADPRFGAQNNTSYFALQFGGWTLLGLDSAYFTTSTFFMLGSIGADSGDTTQNDWIQGLGISADKTIVMTHHTGLSASGAMENSQLCNEVNTALGGDPAAWYWGHIHNGIVYKSPTVANRNTLARCVGHGAIPFGNGYGVAGPFVEYYSHTPNPNLPNTPRVLNGFAMLTISSSGTVTEEFFEQDNATAVFNNTY